MYFIIDVFYRDITMKQNFPNEMVVSFNMLSPNMKNKVRCKSKSTNVSITQRSLHNIPNKK